VQSRISCDCFAKLYNANKEVDIQNIKYGSKAREVSDMILKGHFFANSRIDFAECIISHNGTVPYIQGAHAERGFVRPFFV
jgi:hypothetical protein